MPSGSSSRRGSPSRRPPDRHVQPVPRPRGAHTMSDAKSATKAATSTAAKKPSRLEATDQWTDEELAAMKEHAQELKAAKRRGPGKVDGEQNLLAKIAEMAEPD